MKSHRSTDKGVVIPEHESIDSITHCETATTNQSENAESMNEFIIDDINPIERKPKKKSYYARIVKKENDHQNN